MFCVLQKLIKTVIRYMSAHYTVCCMSPQERRVPTRRSEEQGEKSEERRANREEQGVRSEERGARREERGARSEERGARSEE